MRRILGGIVVIAAVACAPSTTPSPSLGASPPSAVASSQPQRSFETPTMAAPTSGPMPDFAESTVPPSSRWRSGEVFLMAGVREDIREAAGGCRPRRSELPMGATDGIECDVAGEPAERVGAYLFPDDASARVAYEARLREYGVDPSTDGACKYGTSPVPIPEASMPLAACFVNEFDLPNLRMFWPGQSVLVGILGRPGSIGDLDRWARGMGERTTIDVWEGGLGAPTAFEACPDANRPDRVRAPLTIVQQSDGLILSDPDGGDRRSIRTGGVGVANTEWSPDGRLLAYTADSTIWLVDPDGGPPRPLVQTGSLGDYFMGWPALAWSPDGRRIAYMQWRTSLDNEGGERQMPSVWVVDAESGATRMVSDGGFLSWSPDSSQVMVRIEMQGEGNVSGPIAIADLDDGSLSQIGVGVGADWSRDCRSVALVSGSGTVVVYQGVAARPRLAVDASSADWSSATGALAVGSGDGAVWIVPMDGGAPRRFASGGGPVWSDDGSMLLYESDADDLVVARADGSGSTVVASAEYPLSGPVQWSSDGQYLVSSAEFTADTCGGPAYGWVIATDGSGVRMLEDPYHARWRPIDPTPPPDARLDDPPPDPDEGCGG